MDRVDIHISQTYSLVNFLYHRVSSTKMGNKLLKNQNDRANDAEDVNSFPKQSVQRNNQEDLNVTL